MRKGDFPKAFCDLQGTLPFAGHGIPEGARAFPKDPRRWKKDRAGFLRGGRRTRDKERAQIADLIKAETSKDDADQSKPHPDIFEAALERLGDPALEETIVIGDTPYDIEAASKAGMRTIAVRCGGFPEETLRGAISIYDSPEDILLRYEDTVLAGG